ncbi:MAG: malate dehydrogenase (quinone) [Novosphingobium pentaromativorans]|uniref:Probable malate:quinone oxidoreductase n=1 Tax=Novosphingobium pentaromativorans TaxID=205844 RepID=A0A2W5NIS5_9SPHN|nr:malate dehydrogenase (quinone) [Novosphingobium panipatense]PZQ53391.1 MAG: malate dehydrogenase (quinone) [Novosphingobium pentaromativorans]
MNTPIRPAPRPRSRRGLKIAGGVVLALLLAFVAFLYRPLYFSAAPAAENEKPVDVVVIGGGIMSVTLATYLQELEPGWQVRLFERMDKVAAESSNGWNNAGTGHSGFAELNYTPENDDGSIATAKAVEIAEQFEVSRQFWSHEVAEGRLPKPSAFINPTPHMSFVWGDENIAYLHKRQQALVKNPLFYGMQYSQDHAQIGKWAPLVMDGRDPAQKVAATYMPLGTDVNFGVITRQLAHSLQRNPNFRMQLGHEVRGLRRNADRTWNVTVRDLATGHDTTIKSRFVFIGAGGASLKLLQLSGIPEAKNYAGFPVGGQFLAFQAPAVTGRHDVKVYGKAEAGSPPMSVPHLDARKLDGHDVTLFGPFALQSTKFLKNGSWSDLFGSVNNNNVGGMIKVGAENLDLVRYLSQQAMLSDADRQAELVKYYPKARREDWKLITAGQRVQIIKRDPKKGTVLQFGTEIVTDKDGTIAALLGASPGASTSPGIMLAVMEKAFPQQMKGAWGARVRQMVPSYGMKLNDSPALTNRIRRMTSKRLGLPFIAVPDSLKQAPSAHPEPEAGKGRNLNREQQAL